MTLADDARRAARISGFVALTPTMLAAYSLHDAARTKLSAHERSALRDRWFGAWCDAMLRVFGLRVIAIGEPIARGGERGRLVVGNHRGVADVLVLLRAFGGRMVSRADLSRWPLIGVAGRKLGTIFVDRSDMRSGAITIRAMRDFLRSGDTVSIFPEGTTFCGDEVRPFHAGGLAAAIGTGADVVPVGLAYSRDSRAAFLDETFPAHLSKMAAAPPSFVVLSVGAPIAFPPRVKAAVLAELARDAVTREVARARDEANRHERA